MALWAFLAACPCTLFIDIISMFINWANKDACLLGRRPISKIKQIYPQLLHTYIHT